MAQTKIEIVPEVEGKIQAINHKSSTLEIMTCEDFTRLAEIQIGLERRIGQLDILLSVERSAKGLAAGRAEKRLAIALMDLAKQRSKWLRDTNARIDHNFRQIAGDVLSASVYEQIMDKAKFPLKSN